MAGLQPEGLSLEEGLQAGRLAEMLERHSKEGCGTAAQRPALASGAGDTLCGSRPWEHALTTNVFFFKLSFLVLNLFY